MECDQAETGASTSAGPEFTSMPLKGWFTICRQLSQLSLAVARSRCRSLSRR